MSSGALLLAPAHHDACVAEGGTTFPTVQKIEEASRARSGIAEVAAHTQCGIDISIYPDAEGKKK